MRQIINAGTSALVNAFTNIIVLSAVPSLKEDFILSHLGFKKL